MPKPSINKFRSIGDLAPLFRWNVIFDIMPNGLIKSADENGALNVRAESTDLPKDTNQVIELNMRGHRLSYPGISNPTPNLTMTFVEDVNGTISQLIKSWSELIYGKVETGDVTGIQNGDYRAKIRIQRLNNQDAPIWEYTLYNSWLEDAEAGGTLDGATSDFLKPQVILRYDYFTQKKIV